MNNNPYKTLTYSVGCSILFLMLYAQLATWLKLDYEKSILITPIVMFLGLIVGYYIDYSEREHDKFFNEMLKQKKSVKHGTKV